MTSNVRTILAACDFSGNSAQATGRAVDLARRAGARLVLAHVFAPIGSSRVDFSLLPPEFEADALRASQERLDSLAAGLRGEGIEVLARVRRGPIVDGLVAVAADVRADLIVAGAKGQSGLEHVLLGSTAEALVGRAPCPVLVVHENDVPALDPPASILLATDLSDDVDFVAAEVLRLFGARGPKGAPIRLRLAHANHVPPLLQPALRSLTGIDLLAFEHVAPHLLAELEPIAERLRGQGFDTSVELREGDPARSLIELAGVHDVDLVAMATHARSGLSQWLLGSTARRVVQHAPCPVLAVRRPEKA